MTNNKLTDEKIKARINAIEDRRSASRDFWDGDWDYPEDIELLALRELQERRKADEWIPISAPPDDCRVVYCWSEKIRLGIEARYRNGEWAACHDDEEDEEEYITHWMELPKGPRQ
ncbi:valyl-tRNA synthetase [Salmonella enterica subsp. enterica serovar Paratyphi B str. SARA62]|uniref:hypothetical protein n=1 Tax=Salmonella enterica TaxID=28901 RepID=UPI0003BBDF44|nr:hypothetical protein [Salmonella enterica]ESE71673.1 valyl-tRNA synthetase [Salmonella enterica subsp. enterica serovar Paratyphi B str. SARA62]ESF96648.1 valyl-tRNA synthetase [Salmonella enterica subsp. enterica serovar Paratyphi B str. ATCC BAA-1585]